MNKKDNKSTSGGAAYAIMRYMIEGGRGVVFGTVFDENMHLVYKETDTVEGIGEFRGSKYVIARLDNTYNRILEYLQKGNNVLFIGIPCQVAGLYAFLGRDYENLVTVDLLCHGTPSEQFNREHIFHLADKNHIDRRLVKHVRYRTKGSYDFIIQNHGGRKLVRSNEYKDEYVVGFVHGLTYRESCYHCKYAKLPRIGDFTLGDFWGLGNYGIPFEHFTDKGVSLIIVNTDKGVHILKSMEKYIFCEKRLLDEALKEQVTLKHPTAKPEEREKFLVLYHETADFDRSVYQSFPQFFSSAFIRKSLLGRYQNNLKNKLKRMVGVKWTERIKRLKRKWREDKNVSR